MTKQALPALKHHTILYIHKAGSGWGGAQQGVFDMVSHFRNEFQETYFASNRCLLYDRVAQLGVDCHAISISSVKSFPLTLIQLARLLLRLRPDIVHSNHRYASILYMMLKKVIRLKAPLLYTARSSFPDKTRFRMLGDSIVAVSESVKKNLIHQFKISEDKIRTIYNGIELNDDHGQFDAEDPLITNLKESDKIVIGSIGSLVPVKGHAYLFLAVQQLPKEIREKIKLLVVGDGPMRPELETQVHQLGLDDVVIFAGHRADVHRMIDVCSFLINSSVQEGLSRVVVESYLRSRPVIATDLDYAAEVIIPNQSGLIVPVRDCRSLAMAMKRYIENPEMVKMHGVRGKSFIADRFTLSRMLENYHFLYHELLIQKRK
ncbi:glycosyltransferase family 4 protein [candidate division KSB1 bacterium]|nr:glycosyltransferase family 4 protein [candidate division KSB1 bacterium]